MRYYVYVSDAKLDMLAPQIPPKVRDTIAAELKLDLKLLSLTMKSRDNEETRYSKLGLVTQYLHEHEDVGSVDDPRPFFEGSMSMVWGSIGEGRGVYFGAMTDRTILGLAGSPRHVIRAEGVGTVPSQATSASPDLYELLRSTVPTAVEAAPVRLNDAGAGLGSQEAQAVISMTTGLSGPVQQLEFLAKRVGEAWTTPGHGEQPQRILLGTPIYVAQVD